jgi:hypothetical protein
MGLKWLFMTVVSVLTRPEAFWKERRYADGEVNALRDYAAPVIATIQLIKLPLVGVPRSAMILAIVSFVVDVAVLYLLAGALARLFDRHRTESVQQAVMTLLCYGLTPLWLAEPFYFAGWLRLLFAAGALVLSLFIMKSGLPVLFEREFDRVSPHAGKGALLTVVAAMASFTAITGLIRIFTSF